MDLMDLLAYVLLFVAAWAFMRMQQQQHRTLEAQSRALEERQQAVAQLQAELAAAELRARSGRRIISLDALAAVRKCVFVLAPDSATAGSRNTVGEGVFFARNMAATAAHNVTDGRGGYPRFVHGVVHGDGAAASEPTARLQFRVVRVDDTRGVAFLQCCTDYEHFLQPYMGPLEELLGEGIVLCAFQTSMDDVLSRFGFGTSMGVMQASGVKVSRAGRHLVYACGAWACDSDGALLTHDGQLVGIHLELVNALRERLERKKVTEEALGSVDASLDALVRGMAHSCVALLARNFETEFPQSATGPP